MDAKFPRELDTLSRVLRDGVSKFVVKIAQHLDSLPYTPTAFVFLPIRDLHTSGVPSDLLPSEPLSIVKCGSGAFKPLADAFRLSDNPFNRLIGDATPLSSMLAGGLIGAGLGHGGGYLAEKLTGDRVFEPGRLRRRLALAGGLLGTVPGAYLGSMKVRQGLEDGASTFDSLKKIIEPLDFYKQSVQALEILLPDTFVPGYFTKIAEDAGGLFVSDIPVDAFNRVVWNDPNTSLPIRAATVGLVQTASNLSNNSGFVSPLDIARIAMGMGSGLASGVLVGKTLSQLAGVNRQTQKALQDAGIWAGALGQVIPTVFGVR